MSNESTAALDLTGVLLKLGRANTHLEALHAEIRAYWEREPYGLRPKLDAKAGQYSLHVEIEEPAPLRWSVIVGDFIHNLRSALDHLACQLVLVSGGTNIDSAQFPIFTREPTSGRPLAAWQRMTDGMSTRIIKEVRRIQPYTAGDTAKETALGILNALSNEDKHKLLIPTVAAVARHQQGTIGLIERQDVEIIDPEITVGVPLNNGDEIARARIRTTGPNPQVDHQGPIPMDIAFRRGSHHVAVQGLVDLREATTKIAQLLAAVATLDD
jgi:hypothetical protein